VDVLWRSVGEKCLEGFTVCELAVL
jgi:hypothetical protein